MKTVYKVRRVVNGGLVKADAFHAKLAEITEQVAAINKATASELSRELVSAGYRHLLDMSGTQLATMARGLSTADRVMLIEGLTSEVRRLNQLAADAGDMVNGPRAVHDYTAGEAGDVVGLSKQLGHPSAAANVNVREAADEIARVLSIIVDEHEQRSREASQDDGRILQPDQPAELTPSHGAPTTP